MTDAPPEGEGLVAAAMRGDRDAIATLWEQHRRWIAAVLLTYKPAFEDLEDLLQEVAVTFVNKVDTLREETNLRAWLRVIAVNAARAAGRSGRNRPIPGLSENAPLLHDGAVDGRAARDEQTRHTLQRVQLLPEAYREPLLLRALHGMRSRQIADILGLPPATVDTRIARARRMLRQLGHDGADAGEPDTAASRGAGRSPVAVERGGA